MFSKKSLLIILLLVLGGGVFYAVKSSQTLDDPKSRYEKVLRLVGEMLEEGHFSPRKIDDDFSKDIFTKFLQSLDPDKIYFLSGDVAQLKKYELQLDDEIRGASLESFFAINELYKQRVVQSADLYRSILTQPFDYNIDEQYVEDEEKRSYPRNETEWREAWRKKLKYYALERYTDLLEEQEKNKGKEGFVMLSKEEMEKEARDKVLKQFDRMYERFRNRFKDDDRFHQYVNVITESMDPHTTYFPPIEKRAFDEQMRGSFFGIGASLTEDRDNGNIKVATIVNGSPAWKSGEIAVGDYILKVGQGDELTDQDLNGFEVTDAVRLIRGKKGTVVRLTIRKVDGTIKVVSLVRDEIPLDETYAKSLIIESKEHFKIGFIYLPEFYADFDRPNAPRCAPDVAKEIGKLKAQQVDGIILDLRNNGGGSLWDVVQMVGFFIPDGPVVQVKSKDEAPTVLRDRDNGSVLWDGPLVVMVNSLSASASEIFAGAIQDYKRGLVIGSTSTYGKGTVQRNIELDKIAWVGGGAGSDLGSLKLTLQKFYRVSGASTQLRGVYPDIAVPDQYDYLKLREKDTEDALAWDEIEGAPFKAWQNPLPLTNIVVASKMRISENDAFNQLQSSVAWLEKNNKKDISLQLDQFRKKKQEAADMFKKINESLKLKEELSVSNLPVDLARIEQDSIRLERNKIFLKGIRTDLLVGETVKVVSDMIMQTQVVKKD